MTNYSYTGHVNNYFLPKFFFQLNFCIFQINSHDQHINNWSFFGQQINNINFKFLNSFLANNNCWNIKTCDRIPLTISKN